MTDLFGPGAYGAARAAASRPSFTPANGGGDPDTFAKDCSSQTARDGTEWRASLLNALIIQMRGAVRKSGAPESNLDDSLLARALRGKNLRYAVAGGTADAMTATLDPAPTAGEIGAGFYLWVLSPGANAGGSPTIAINGAAALNIVDQNGGGLRAGDTRGVILLHMDGTSARLINIDAIMRAERQNLATYGGFTPSISDTALMTRAVRGGVLTYFGTGGSSTAYTVTQLLAFTGLSELKAGFTLSLLVHTPNTTASPTLNVDAVGAKNLLDSDGNSLAIGDFQGMCKVVYDGTSFRVTTFSRLGIRRLAKATTTVVFSGAGTTNWTVPAGVYQINARAISAGGGGGGSPGGGYGSGGGGGADAFKSIAVTPGDVIAMTRGAGGAGGTGPGVDGADGGATSVGAHMSVTGGGKGLSNNSGGGSSGSATGADWFSNNQGGGLGAAGTGGPGGGGSFGGGGIPTATNGGAGTTTGSGGAGGYNGYAGGAGAAGVIIIQY